MSIVPGLIILKERHGAVGGVVFSGALSLVAQVDPSGWLRDGVFLFHHELECDEAAVMEYIRGRVALVIAGSGGCCNLTACDAYGVSCEVAFACRVVLLSANALSPLLNSCRELDLLRHMVRSELVHQCVPFKVMVWKSMCMGWLVFPSYMRRSERSWIWSVGT